MKRTSLEGRTLIDNSNSGLDIKTARKALAFAQAQRGRIIMVLGEEAREVCEGLDPDAVAQFVADHLDDISDLILVGERMRSLLEINTDRIHFAENLSEGIDIAKGLTGDRDIILSCVKCFR